MTEQVNLTKKPDTPRTFTVREMIARLANCEDMDTIVNISFCNSDPMPVVDVEDGGAEEGVVTLTVSS